MAIHLQSFFAGIICLATGLPMLFFARRTRLAAKAKTEDRKAYLSAGASEHYFEEARTLNAYPLPATDRKWRKKGLLLTAAGIILLGLSLLR